MPSIPCQCVHECAHAHTDRNIETPKRWSGFKSQIFIHVQYPNTHTHKLTPGRMGVRKSEREREKCFQEFCSARVQCAALVASFGYFTLLTSTQQQYFVLFYDCLGVYKT